MSKQATPVVSIPPMYLPRLAAANFLALGETTFATMVARQEAPQPRKLSANRVGWLVSELESWGAKRPVSDLPPPQNSGYGRDGKPD